MSPKKTKISKINGQGCENCLSRFRIYTTIFMILISSGLVFFRLYALQVRAHDEYKSIASNQHKFKQEILPVRGEIFLREKNNEFPVAVNRELMTAFAVPKEIEDLERATVVVSEALSLDQSEVARKLSKKDDFYEVLKRKLSNHEVEKIRQLKEKGIFLEGENWRYYPSGSLASNVVGYVGYQDKVLEGIYGVERYFEDELQGKSGMLEQERDTFGRWISVGSKSVTPARDGRSIVLTLNHVLQFKAETVLKNAVKRHGADSGKIVISDPYSGQILALASFPTFNPNEYSDVENVSVFRNPIVSDEYECGSVFKTITMAAGLDTGKVTPETTYIDTGQVVEAGFKIKNSDEKSYGEQTMTNVIEKSLNTGAIHVVREVGNQQFIRYVKDFGFGSKSGIELPGEISGNISNLRTNRDIEFYTASFGQGITVTPLQLVMAYGAIANGGELLKSHIIYSIQNSAGEEKKFEKEVERTVISRETANQLTLMLESNVVDGHGKLAGVPGYRVAGKTGTAQIPDKEKGGYLENATTGTFAGFGPVENPVFSMVVIIDYPKDVEWAESTAAPVFGEMSKFMFDYYGIEPTQEYSQKDFEKFTRTHNYLADKKEIEDDDEFDKEENEVEEND
ncbi:MAG: penicillin-binding protein 2 [Patescibacteria group bacterium]|nr:penicillin-binding protein 2 [Patescibacteria group bacterium]